MAGYIAMGGTNYLLMLLIVIPCSLLGHLLWVIATRVHRRGERPCDDGQPRITNQDTD